MSLRTTLGVTALLGAGLLAPAFGQTSGTPNAQTPGTPSADAIVKSLTPTAGVDSTTRGIRIGNAPAGQPASAPAAAKAPAVSLNIEFATGSADLTPQAIGALDQLGQALDSATLAVYRFRIEGHTDTVGSAALNKSLSERRAESVVSYLTSKYHIDPARLQAIGMGENGLLVSTPANTPEARNRRVLVVNVGS